MSTCHLVGCTKARRRGVVSAAHKEHVWKYQMQSARWLQPEWRNQCEGGCSPRLLREPPTVHRGSGSPLPRVSYRMSLGKPVCRWPGHRHWIAGETTWEADPLENQHGTKGTFGQQGQNQGPDGPRLGVLQRSDKDPCGVCLKGVGTNSIFVVVVPVAFAKDAVVCLVPWSLIPDSGVNDVPKKPIDGRPVTEVTVGRKKIGVMPLRRHNVNWILWNGFSEISNKIYKYIVTQMQLKMSSAKW